MQTTTDDYLPGAVGGQAVGYGARLNDPTADSHTGVAEILVGREARVAS
jgi:hypothetical protein